jgi:hypothetical protein
MLDKYNEIESKHEHLLINIVFSIILLIFDIFKVSTYT